MTTHLETPRVVLECSATRSLPTGSSTPCALAHGMTHKWAALGLPFGGAKAVLAIDHVIEGAEREGLLERYGTLVESLGCIFATGEDLGTTARGFRHHRSAHALRSRSSPRDTREGRSWSVHGARSLLRNAGRPHERSLVTAYPGARYSSRAPDMSAAAWWISFTARARRFLVTDLDPEAAQTAAQRVGGTVIPPDSAYVAECDIYAPCAVGATLNADTIQQLRCRLIAGSANNQLAVSEDADRLHQRGIVYTPDYIVNAGGALAFALLGGGEHDIDALFERMADIGRTVTEVLRQARRARRVSSYRC